MNSGKILEDIGNATSNQQKFDYHVGDTVVVYFKINEGDKDVAQKFKGIVIGDRGKGINRSITVRHLTGGVGVERVFPINSPNIEKVEIIRRGDVRRAKLYYIRDLKGKAAVQVKEKRFVSEKKKSK